MGFCFFVAGFALGVLSFSGALFPKLRGAPSRVFTLMCREPVIGVAVRRAADNVPHDAAPAVAQWVFYAHVLLLQTIRPQLGLENYESHQ